MVGEAPKIQILLGEVVDIDPEASEVVLNGQHLGYDQLILATGSGSTCFGRPDRGGGGGWPRRLRAGRLPD
jgi:NADH dehydrogenase